MSDLAEEVEGALLFEIWVLFGILLFVLDCANLDGREAAGLDDTEESILGRPNDTTSLSAILLSALWVALLWFACVVVCIPGRIAGGATRITFAAGVEELLCISCKKASWYWSKSSSSLRWRDALMSPM